MQQLRSQTYHAKRDSNPGSHRTRRSCRPLDHCNLQEWDHPHRKPHFRADVAIPEIAARFLVFRVLLKNCKVCRFESHNNFMLFCHSCYSLLDIADMFISQASKYVSRFHEERKTKLGSVTRKTYHDLELIFVIFTLFALTRLQLYY